MKRLAAALVSLLALGNLAGCRREAVPPPDRVALVEAEVITYRQFEVYLEQQLGEPGRGLASDVLSRMFDQFLTETLLARLAIDRGLVPPAAGRRAALDRLLAADEGVEPVAEEIAEFYRAHRDEFARPERVRLRQILTEDRASAEAALAELRAGAEFGRVAERVSSGAGEPIGGPQGELSRDELPPAFADVIFRLAPGELSEVVEARYGYHVFQVVERLPAEILPLAAARAEIRDRLRRERADSLLAALAEEARTRYNVQVYERNLPFNYRGIFLVDPS